MSKLTTIVAALFLAAVVGLSTAVPSAYAWHRVDCAKVMKDLKAGKTEKATAADLHISRSSVYRCKVKARRAAEVAKKADHKADAGTKKN